MYTVDQTKYAIKFQLGEVVDVKTEAGLYFKLPLIQNVRFFDARNLTLENVEPDRMTTSEKKAAAGGLHSYCGGSSTCASTMCRSRATRKPRADACRRPCDANLAEEFNKRTVNEAISTERDKITAATRARANADAKSIGVEVIDVRLRRIELPPDVTGPVYQRMESERRRVANELRSTGAAEAERIRADADRQRQVILADAYKQAQTIKGEGDAKASTIYADAFSANPEFYDFFRSLESLPHRVPQQERRAGARSGQRVLQVLPPAQWRQRAQAARGHQVGLAAGIPGFTGDTIAVDGVRAGPGHRRRAAVRCTQDVARRVPPRH